MDNTNSISISQIELRLLGSLHSQRSTLPVETHKTRSVRLIGLAAAASMFSTMALVIYLFQI